MELRIKLREAIERCERAEGAYQNALLMSAKQAQELSEAHRNLAFISIRGVEDAQVATKTKKRKERRGTEKKRTRKGMGRAIGSNRHKKVYKKSRS